MKSDLHQFERFTATFQPQRTDDLKPEARKFVGLRCEWQALWVIGQDGEHLDYRGQWACNPEADEFPFSWVPDGDLIDRTTPTYFIEPKSEVEAGWWRRLTCRIIGHKWEAQWVGRRCRRCWKDSIPDSPDRVSIG